ncbi:protein OS-9 isoform X1, partial [Tachysurus ichikawai]
PPLPPPPFPLPPPPSLSPVPPPSFPPVPPPSFPPLPPPPLPPPPLLTSPHQMADVMLVSNKYKQLYECRLPAQAVKFHQDASPDSDPRGYSGPAVPELLKPMHSAPCLTKTKDWWTYEFCYGQHIRQYHQEDSEIKGDVLFLGYFESEFDWTNETAKATKQHKLKRYHSQSYVNGSKCDLNGNPRESEVR